MDIAADDTFQTDQAFFLPSEFLSLDDILKDHNSNKQAEPSFPSEFPFEFEFEPKPSSGLTRGPHPFPSYRNYLSSRLGFPGSPPPPAPSQPHFGRTPVSTGAGARNLASPALGPTGNSWDFSAFNKDYVERVREELRDEVLLKDHLEKCLWLKNHAQKWNIVEEERVGRSATGGYGKKEQVAWRSLQSIRQQSHENRTVSRGGFVIGGSGNQFSGGGVKKQRSGTGVFLPRSYGANNHNHVKKSGCLTAPILDRGGPGYYSKGSITVMDSGVVKHHGQTRVPDEFDSDYDLQLAKMKLLLLQRRQHIRPGSIPQGGAY